MRKYCVILLSLGTLLFSQEMSTLNSAFDLSKVTKQKTLQPLDQPLIEKAVEADVYILGPGDVLNIIVNGETENAEQVMISPEGFFIHPATGNFKVAGLSLSQARKDISHIFKSKYITNNIDIALMQVRMFRVTVSGAVNFPGLVPVNGMDRVSDAIFAAGGLIEIPSEYPEPEDPRKVQGAARKEILQNEISKQTWEDAKNDAASKRNIKIKRFDGSTVHVDLLKYELAGDVDANPYLVDGDVIVVPSVQKNISELMISGAVRTPDTFEWAPGDNIATLLQMAHGFTLDADSSRILLTRFKASSSRAFEQELTIDWSDENSVNKALSTSLKPDDRVFVRRFPKFHVKRTIEIKGEVMFPGEYALTDNPTMLSDVIEKAGGFTNDAALFNAYVIRKSLEEIPDPKFESLEFLTTTEMERRDKAYYEIMSRQIKGRLNTNFVELFENKNSNYDFPLKNKDLVIIPSKTFTVNVIGQVKKPGLVKWHHGYNAKDYIKLAGGFNSGAWRSQARVIKASTGELIALRNTDIDMGDMIFIPPRIERKNRDFITTLTSIITTIALVTMYAFQIEYYNSK